MSLKRQSGEFRVRFFFELHLFYCCSPHSNPVLSSHAFLIPPAQESSSGSESGISTSVSLTPLHTYTSIPAEGEELIYPIDFYPSSIDLSGVETQFDTTIATSWDTIDAEITPRVASEGFDKSLA
jgi:hypothetical protein